MRCKEIMQVPSSCHCFYNIRIFSVLISILNFAWPRSDPDSQVVRAQEQRGRAGTSISQAAWAGRDLCKTPCAQSLVCNSVELLPF